MTQPAQQLLLPTAARAAVMVWDWSRDGRFILYTTIDTETGRRELWALPLDGERKPLTMGRTGSEARFSPDGHLDRKVEAGEPMSLFQLPPGVRLGQAGMRALSTDGERFLIGVPTRRSTQVPFTVVLNWPALMRN